MAFDWWGDWDLNPGPTDYDSADPAKIRQTGCVATGFSDSIQIVKSVGNQSLSLVFTLQFVALNQTRRSARAGRVSRQRRYPGPRGVSQRVAGGAVQCALSRG